jgi:hypothetical protein
VVVERAARRLDDADALAGDAGRQHAHVGVGDVGVGGQLVGALGRVEQLDEARPVGRQRRVHRLAAERREVALVLGLGERRRHAVGGVEARERRGPVDAESLPSTKPFQPTALR